jgi:hypothetical protein
LDTDAVECHDTTTSREASAPNWVCKPATRGAALRSGRCHNTGESGEAHPVGERNKTTPPTPKPAALASRVRRPSTDR